MGAATYNRSRSEHASSSASGSGRIQGPTLPSQSDLTLAREETESHRSTERNLKRKRDRKEGKERVEDMVGPKAVGKEGMLENKRAKREADRTFREKGDDGFEADESTLMGGGDSFRDQYVTSVSVIWKSLLTFGYLSSLARRDASRKRFEEKKLGSRDERDAGARERVNAIRQKDKATMDMFMQMAKEKFG